MKSLSFLVIVGSMMFLSASAVHNSMSWNIAEGYSIKFAGTDAEGIFKDLTGDIQFDAANPEKFHVLICDRCKLNQHREWNEK